MTKFKTLFSLCIVVAIVSTCVLSASAALSSSTSVYWGPKEDYAWAETVGSGSTGRNFYVDAYIKSLSTNDYQYDSACSDGIYSTITASTPSVSITYPSPIPLVDYGGSHWYVD